MISEMRTLSENKWDCSPQHLEGLAENKIGLKGKKKSRSYYIFFVKLKSLGFSQFMNKCRTEGRMVDSIFQAVHKS